MEYAHHRDTDEPETAGERPRHAVAAPPATAAEQVLALQRGAGNAAVARLMRLVNPTPVESRTVAEVRAMDLGELASFARRQADWRTLPSLAAVKDDLWRVLEWAEAGPKPAASGGAKDLKVGELLDLPFTAPAQKTLRAYADAVDDAGLQIDSAKADLGAAMRWGRALEKLVPKLHKGVLKRTVQQNENWSHLDLLTAYGDYVDPFITYVTTDPKPLLDSDREVYSYFQLMHDDTVDPQGLKGVVKNIRNHHRFHGTSLTALKEAWSKGNVKKLPFTLVLYPALDHNGAFHRDDHIDEVIKSDKNFTLVIEGAKTIADITSALPGLAAAYGVDDAGGKKRIQQVMIAGHGNSRGMELAGDVIPGKEGEENSWDRNKGDDLFLDSADGKKNADALFKGLLDEMDPHDPKSRILLNACLTASADFQPADDISTSRRQASKQVAAIVAARPNFADYLRAQAAARGHDPKQLVSAANASFTAEAQLIDPATGELRLASPANYDPQLANADRMEYIRDGSEPEGYMRAVLENYGTRRPEVVKALRAKLASPERAQWPDRVTRSFARASLHRIHEPHLLAAMIEAAPLLGECNSDSECTVERLEQIPKLLVNELFPLLTATPHAPAWTATPSIRLVVLQAWALHGPGHDTALLTELGSRTVEQIQPKVDLGRLAAHGALARLRSGSLAGPAGEGRLRLLLLETLAGAPSAATLAALRRLRGRRPRFLPADHARLEAALGAAGDADSILAAIEEPAAGGGGGGGGGGAGAPPAKDANLDTDGDGRNDVYVEHLTRRGENPAADVDLLEQPKPGAAAVKHVAKGTELLVIGRAEGGWLAVEEGGKTRFVREADLPLK